VAIFLRDCGRNGRGVLFAVVKPWRWRRAAAKPWRSLAYVSVTGMCVFNWRIAFLIGNVINGPSANAQPATVARMANSLQRIRHSMAANGGI